jgi:hypothetical protein
MPVSFNDKLARWDALNTNLKPQLQLPEMAHLQKGQEEFERLVQRGFEIVAQQNQYVSLFRQIIVDRNELDQKASQLSEFLSLGLRHAFGSRSQKLREFGIKPRAAIKRKVKPPVETAPPTPAAESEPLESLAPAEP